MNTAEFRCWREFLGLPESWVAKQVGVTVETLRKWEKSEGQVNRLAGLLMRHWVNQQQRLVSTLTVSFSKEPRPIRAPMDNHEGLDMPPGWHRAIAARVAERSRREIVWYQEDMHQ